VGRRFENKVVLITGASAGIGAATARQLAREGAKLALLARRKDKLENVCAEIENEGGTATPFIADVTNRASLDAAVAGTAEKYGRLDIVLANAGSGIAGPIYKLEVEDFRRQFETNFFGVLNTIYAALPHLKESRGQLGLIGSIAGIVATPNSSPYNTSKFAIVGLAESIYYDLSRLGISVTLINPGFVKSEIRHINNRGELTDKPDPVPGWLVLPADKAAKTISNALYYKKPEVIITFHGKVFSLFKRFFPRLTRWGMRRMIKGRLAPL